MKRLISRGTEAAFALGADMHKRRGGCAPGLRHAVAMHKANAAEVALVERIARALRFGSAPAGVLPIDEDEVWKKLPHGVREYWRGFARLAIASVDGRRMAETENTGSVPQGTTSAVPSEASADAPPSAPSLQTPQGGDS